MSVTDGMKTLAHLQTSERLKSCKAALAQRDAEIAALREVAEAAKGALPMLSDALDGAELGTLADDQGYSALRAALAKLEELS